MKTELQNDSKIKPIPAVLKHRSFNQKSGRFRHDLVCSECGRTFTNMNMMKDHLVKHAGLRPFKCRMCKMAFSQRRIRNKHEKHQNCVRLKQKSDKIFKLKRRHSKVKSRFQPLDALYSSSSELTDSDDEVSPEVIKMNGQ